VAEIWRELSAKTKELAGSWTAYTALGSFALYLLGYLALRFHLTVLGIGTDLAVLDERYLFTGAKFLVYLATAVPIAVLVGLCVLLLVKLLRLPYWLLPGSLRARVWGWCQHLLTWWAVPTRLALTGIILAVVLIQFVMRQCFVLGNLLLQAQLSEAVPAWLRCLLVAETDGLRSLYFAGLVAGTAVTAGLYVVAKQQRRHSALSRLLMGLLVYLVAVQFLLLPVNYGILIADKTMPRVANLGGQKALDKGQTAWLVWEGKDGVTYLIRGLEAGKDTRKLVTLPRDEVKRTEITGYDPIMRVLFGGPTQRTVLPLGSAKEKPQ
jgi:hypothetical protein